MTGEQALVFAVLGVAMVFFVWGRWRYDLVAVVALLVLVVADVVPESQAFQSLGHPAVVTVAAVLILSRGLQSSGVVDSLARWLSRGSQATSAQVARLTGVAAASSGFMNNVASMALLMPVAISMGRLRGKLPSLFLMPLAFATMLGGLMTIIGTPPNIIISTFRQQAGGLPFQMFDFASVGVPVAVVGVAFLALVGWRLVPRRQSPTPPEELFDIKEYITEVRVPPDSKAVGKSVHDIEAVEDQETGGVVVLDVIRDGRRLSVPPAYLVLQTGDVLVLETASKTLVSLLNATGLQLLERKPEGTAKAEEGEEEVTREAVVTYDSPLVGQTARRMDLRWRYGINVLAIARHGSRIRERLQSVVFRAGDIILIQGPYSRVRGALQELDCLPLAERELPLGRPRRFFLSIAIFALAVGLATAGVLPIPIALVSGAITMILLRVLTLQEAYTSINGPIIILLAAMIPVGMAMETTGGSQLLVDALLRIAPSLPVAGLVLITMVTAMLLTALVNNAATAVVMAPLAFSLAHSVGASPDPFLMAVALGASSAFLTPIAHQSGTLAWRPGGYQFSDYLRVGLPLALVVLAVGLPMILLVWPLWDKAVAV